MIPAIIIVCLAIIFFYYSEFNYKTLSYKNYDYNVHTTGGCDSAKMISELDSRARVLKKHLLRKYGCRDCSIIGKFNMYERTIQLEAKYSHNNIYEISPSNILGNTSFTEDKGRKIVMCLRDKSTGAVHDTNTLMFVFLHELTHVMNDRWGHERYFWELFKVVLEDAVEARVYTAIDYKKNPVKYCGMIIDQNPLYDF